MSKKKIRKNIGKAIVHVKATFNNTIVTMNDLSGETLCWDSAGTVGFKGARKATPFAAAPCLEQPCHGCHFLDTAFIVAQSFFDVHSWCEPGILRLESDPF